jgi:arylsulfatase
MEVYAGYLTYTDYTVGRLINYLKQSNLLDNTVVFVLIGDNGASKEGSFQGVISRGTFAPGGTEEKQLQENLEKIGEIGTAAGKNTNYPLGWAQATNAPFKYWKQDANAEGGTHNPLIVFYPKGIKEKGGIRTQYSHVIDLLPTTLDITGIKLPAYIRNVKQDTIQGISLFASLNNGNAPSLHHVQHYYIFGARSIYKDGWKAGTLHHPDILDFAAAASGKSAPFVRDWDKDVWELYNLNEDFNERFDLAKKYPGKLEELKKLFDTQAKKNNLYPLIDWQDVFQRKIHNTAGAKNQTIQQLTEKVTNAENKTSN